jgi:hypothetical protein
MLNPRRERRRAVGGSNHQQVGQSVQSLLHLPKHATLQVSFPYDFTRRSCRKDEILNSGLASAYLEEFEKLSPESRGKWTLKMKKWGPDSGGRRAGRMESSPCIQGEKVLSRCLVE